MMKTGRGGTMTSALLPKLSVKDSVFIGIVLAMFALMPVAAVAGGLAFAPILAICGVAWLVTSRRSDYSYPPAWVILLGLFCLWALLTSLWSSYSSSDILTNPVKFAVGMVLYISGVKAIHKAINLRARLMMFVCLGVSFVLAIFLLFNLYSEYALTFFFDPLREEENLTRKLADTQMSNGNAITLFALAMIPAASILLTKKRVYKALALVLFGASLLAAIKGGQANVVIALIMGICVFALTYYFPKVGIKLVTGFAMGMVLFAPFLGFILPMITAEQLAKLPFSWEYRVRMWEYACSRISESPIFGHGFDSVRTFTDTFEARGFPNLPYISLHPHNAGLHIWLEIGAVGAVILALLIWSLGRQTLILTKNSSLMSAAYASFGFLVIFIGSVSYGVWQDWWWAGGLSFLGCIHVLTCLDIFGQLETPLKAVD